VQILKVEGALSCTSRIHGLKHVALRVLQDTQGKRLVATDPVGAEPGNWVFVTSGSAARYTAGDFEILTDLAVCGIIDHWPEKE
jgi:ethanolamine utilization protein EutN